MARGSLDLNRLPLPPLPVVLGTVFGLLLAVTLGVFVGSFSILKIWAVFLVLGSVCTVLILGTRYWLLIPLSFTIDLPAFPVFGRAFQLSELATAGCICIFLAGIALKREKVPRINSSNLAIWGYFAWVALVFFKNPVGLSVMGSEVAGAREYAKIALALAGFLIVSSRAVNERDSKFLVGVLLWGPMVSSAWAIASYFLGFADPLLSADGFYTWHQALSAPANAIVLYLFSRYSISEIFSLKRPWTVVAIVVALLLVAFSGKRAVAATMLATPVFAAFFRKNYKFIAVYGVLALIGLYVLIAGHNTFFKLPIQTQRVLMNLPGDWDPSLKGYVEEGGDNFRARMRELAWDQIRKNPIVGDGLGIEFKEVLAAIDATGGTEEQTFLLAQGSSWHSAWLGILADFGIPAAVLMLILVFQRVRLSVRVFRMTSEGTSFHTLALMLLILFLQQLMRSYTSGTAVSASEWWWGYGLLLGLLTTIQGKGGISENNSGTSVPAAQSKQLS